MPDESLIKKRKECPHCEHEFFKGVICSLAVLAGRGDATSTAYNEIVDANGTEDIVKWARRDGAMRWSGLSDFVKSSHYKRFLEMKKERLKNV